MIFIFPLILGMSIIPTDELRHFAEGEVYHQADIWFIAMERSTHFYSWEVINYFDWAMAS